MPFSLPIIVAIASAAGILFTISVLTCFFCRQRKKEAQAKLEEGDIFATVATRPSFLRRNFVTPDPGVSLEVDHHLRRFTVTPVRSSHNGDFGSHFRTDRTRTPSNLRQRELPYSGSALKVPSNVSRRSSSRTEDTASIYSATSAPLELHDQILSGKTHCLDHASTRRASLPAGMWTPPNVTGDTGLFRPRRPRRASILMDGIGIAEITPLHVRKGHPSRNSPQQHLTGHPNRTRLQPRRHLHACHFANCKFKTPCRHPSCVGNL